MPGTPEGRNSSEFCIGDGVRIWKPGYAEHGCYGVVTEIRPWDGWPGMDSYTVCADWSWPDGSPGFRGCVGARMVMFAHDWGKHEARRTEWRP